MKPSVPMMITYQLFHNRWTANVQKLNHGITTVHCEMTTYLVFCNGNASEVPYTEASYIEVLLYIKQYTIYRWLHVIALSDA
jgi:hypothetical protein